MRWKTSAKAMKKLTFAHGAAGGGEINLTLPHGYDRELDASVHRQCEASE